MITGSPTSVRAVLMNLSQKEGLPFQQVITRYLHERLLYRLSMSIYKQNFILKGGNLLYALEGLHIRPTMDIDMLAMKIADNKETLKNIFMSICSVQYDDDCVIFDVLNIAVSDIAEEKKYSGVRLLINVQFGTIKQTIQIDIGFGDIVTPAPLLLSYPTLLHELNTPELMAYSIETVIAEKFHAMIALGVFNSRMKDFYDVYMLFNNNKIETNNLQLAILQTFRQRDTVFVENHPFFIDEFYENQNRQTMWKAFLRKIKHPENLDFSIVVKSITERLYPIYLELENKTK